MSPRRHNRGRHNGAAATGAPPAPATGALPAPADSATPAAAAGSNGLSGVGRPAGAPPAVAPRRPPRPVARVAPAAPAAVQPVDGDGAEETPVRRSGCTLAQLRRFIKSRPYMPVHELRRRFLIEGCEDEVNSVATDKGLLYVGLPATEAQYLSELIRTGEVGYELLLDPTSPAVIGVFPMRPIARQ